MCPKGTHAVSCSNDLIRPSEKNLSDGLIINVQGWVDPLGLTKRIYKHSPYHEFTYNAVRRVGIDNANEEIVVLDRTREISDGVEEFHGHV